MTGPPDLIVTHLVVVEDAVEGTEKSRRAKVGWQLRFSAMQVHLRAIDHAHVGGHRERRRGHACWSQVGLRLLLLERLLRSSRRHKHRLLLRQSPWRHGVEGCRGLHARGHTRHGGGVMR